MNRTHHKHLLLHLVLAHHATPKEQSQPKFVGDRITQGIKRRLAHSKELLDLREELKTAQATLVRLTSGVMDERERALTDRVRALEKRIEEMER